MANAGTLIAGSDRRHDSVPTSHFTPGPRALTYAGTLVLIALATWGRSMLNAVLGEEFPFLFCFPVLIGAAWWGGAGPTLMALAVSLPLATYLFTPLLHSAGPGWLAVGVYFTVGIGLAFISGRRHSTESARAQVTAELAQREAELRLITDSLPVLIASLDLQQRYVFVNKHSLVWYGLPEHEVLGRHVRDVMGPEAYEKIEPYIAQGLSGGRVQFELPLNYRSGESRWVNALYVPRPDESGNVQGLFVMVNDITERKQGERALRDSEERFRHLADSMPQIVWTAADDGVIDYFNRRWYEYTGQPRDDLAEALPRALHPDDKAAALRAWQETVQAGTEYQAEFRLRAASGDFHWVLARANPVRDDSGQIVRWYGTSTDIDEKMQAQARLTKAVEDLNRTNKELEDFAYLTSHDLKEPLRGIRSYTSFVLEDSAGRLDTEAVRKLQTIDRLGERVDRLISTLLYYSQVGRTELSLAPTDLGAVVGNVLGSLATMFRAAEADVRVVGPLPVVLCDATRGAEVFRNLIVNAIRFNNSPVPRIELGVQGVDQNGWPILTVSDNGIGIPVEHYQTVFRMFKRLHGRDDYGGGTGAGLALVKKIVERHGGHVWIKPSASGGTTFCFTLGRYAHAVDAADPDR